MKVNVRVESREFRNGDGSLDRTISGLYYCEPTLKHGCFEEYDIAFSELHGKFAFYSEEGYREGGDVNYCPKCGLYLEYHYTEPEMVILPTNNPGEGELKY